MVVVTTIFNKKEACSFPPQAGFPTQSACGRHLLRNEGRC